jgi:hypothetical protein
MILSGNTILPNQFNPPCGFHPLPEIISYGKKR